MIKLFWKLRYAMYMKKKAGYPMEAGLDSAQVWIDDVDDWQDWHPHDAAAEELSNWG